jgi:hypothetical protein
MIESVSKYPPPARRSRYILSILGSMLVYVFVLAVSLSLLKHSVPSPWKFVIAALPMLPALWVPLAAVRFFRELDELQKQVQLEGLAFGFIAAAVLTLTYGFLQNAGLPEVSWVWVWPVMAVGWMTGVVCARWRYR